MAKITPEQIKILDAIVRTQGVGAGSAFLKQIVIKSPSETFDVIRSRVPQAGPGAPAKSLFGVEEAAALGAALVEPTPAGELTLAAGLLRKSKTAARVVGAVGGVSVAEEVAESVRRGQELNIPEAFTKGAKRGVATGAGFLAADVGLGVGLKATRGLVKLGASLGAQSETLVNVATRASSSNLKNLIDSMVRESPEFVEKFIIHTGKRVRNILKGIQQQYGAKAAIAAKENKLIPIGDLRDGIAAVREFSPTAAAKMETILNKSVSKNAQVIGTRDALKIRKEMEATYSEIRKNAPRGADATFSSKEGAVRNAFFGLTDKLKKANPETLGEASEMYKAGIARVNNIEDLTGVRGRKFIATKGNEVLRGKEVKAVRERLQAAVDPSNVREMFPRIVQSDPDLANEISKLAVRTSLGAGAVPKVSGRVTATLGLAIGGAAALGAAATGQDPKKILAAGAVPAITGLQFPRAVGAASLGIALGQRTRSPLAALIGATQAPSLEEILFPQKK